MLIINLYIAGAEGFITSGSSVIKNSGKKVAAHITATIAKNASDVLKGDATIGDAVVNSAIDVIGGSGKIKLKHFQVTKPTTANQAVKAAKSNGKKITTSDAKKIALDTRNNNIVKKETNAVINDFADSSVPIAATSVIKGVRKRLNNEKEKEK